MYKHVLLPLDLTNKHRAAVQAAAEMAQQSGGRVTLLHVVELIPGLGRDEEPAFYDRLEKSAQKHLETIGAALTAKNVKWTPVILFGQRVQETVRFAMDEGCDLIVATAPTFDAEHPTVGWGSLSFKISVLSPTPVLLVKG